MILAAARRRRERSILAARSRRRPRRAVSSSHDQRHSRGRSLAWRFLRSTDRRTGDTDIWVPVAQHQHILPVYGADLITSPKARVFYGMVGRLAPGASLESVIAQTEALRQRLSAESPKDYQLAHWHFIVRRGLEARPWVVERLTRSMTLLMGAVGLLLILTAANVGNLMLVRATARRAEIATRLALGASRARVARLLLIESVLLSLGAGALALVLAALVGRTLEGVVVLQSLPPMDRPLLDWRVFAFACAASLVVACGAGVFPHRRQPRRPSRVASGRCADARVGPAARVIRGHAGRFRSRCSWARSPRAIDERARRSRSWLQRLARADVFRRAAAAGLRRGAARRSHALVDLCASCRASGRPACVAVAVRVDRRRRPRVGAGSRGGAHGCC